MVCFAVSERAQVELLPLLGECFHFLWHAPGKREGKRGLLGVEVLNFWKQGGSASIYPSSSHVTSRWPWRLFSHKSSADACSQTRVQVPQTPAKSGNEGVCVCVCARPISGEVKSECGPGAAREWRWTPPALNPTASRWAAEMSSRTDGPEQITNNTQRYKTAETHCWRWLILQTEIWGRTTEKKEGGREGEPGRRGREVQEHQVQDTKIYVSFSALWNPPFFFFRTKIHHVCPNTYFFAEGENVDRRKASAGGEVKRTQPTLFSPISSILLD